MRRGGRTLIGAVALVTISATPTYGLGGNEVRPTTSALSSTLKQIAHDYLISGQAQRSDFFPQAAYVTMKSGLVPSPSSDWTHRLWALYQLDVSSTHQWLAAHGPVRYVGYRANLGAEARIAIGDCENHVGYWHLPGVRLEFRSARGPVSFLIASLISWNGQWFVVHLGPNPRPTNVGTLDGPLLAVGGPGMAGGC